MINLDTCLKVTDSWVPLSDWKDSLLEAAKSTRDLLYLEGQDLLEIGVHFGKPQYRYSLHINAARQNNVTT
jgi:hypothetical protein